MRWFSAPDPVTVKRTGSNRYVAQWRDVTYTVSTGFSFDPEFEVVQQPVLGLRFDVIADKMIAGSSHAARRRDRADLIDALQQQLPAVIRVGVN